MASASGDSAGISPAPTFLTMFSSGRLDWDLLQPFPEQETADRSAGDALVEEIGSFFEARLDADDVDRTGELPEGFLDELQARGYLRLQSEAEIGGLELSAYNTFRAISRAASCSTGVGQIMAVQNGVGLPSLIPATPPGELRDFMRRRVAEGVVSGFGITEPAGQNNTWPGMTATPTEDGSAYVLRGEKLFTGNGPVADVVAVTATVLEGDQRRLSMCLVDTRSAGFSVKSSIEFVGSRGLPDGALSFEDVRVPAELVLLGELGDPRPAPPLAAVALLGQLHVAGAPAMAIARNCLKWSREFASQRRIDGRNLAEYDLIQRIIAATLSDVFAMDSVIQWSLVPSGLADRPFERLLAKNILATTAGRIVDRTVSLFGGAGVETVRSKLRRGAVPIPVERAYRDVRALRITGNVDIQLDNLAGRLLLSLHLAGSPQGHSQDSGPESVRKDHLSSANRVHLDAATQQVRQLAAACSEIVRRQGDPRKLFENEQTCLLLGRISAELFSMCAVLSRASHRASVGADDSQGMADVFCTAALHRLADLWRQLDSDAEPDHAEVSRSWMTGTAMDFLIQH